MQDDFNSMVHEMLGYSPSDEIPETEFARLTAIYAYSPFIQFLYSQKLREKDPHRYAASVAKTALYFSNPHWLNHQLRNEQPSEFKTRNYHSDESVVIETGEVEIDEIIEADEHSEVNIANETFDQHPAHVVDSIPDETTPQVEEIKEEPVTTINDLYSSGEPTINEELLTTENIPDQEIESVDREERENETPVVEIDTPREESIPDEEIRSTQTYQEEFLPDDASEIVQIGESYDQLDSVHEETEPMIFQEGKTVSDELTNVEEPPGNVEETKDALQTEINTLEENNQLTVESSENINTDAVVTEHEPPIEVVNDVDQVELPDSTIPRIDTAASAPLEEEGSPKSKVTGELAFEPLYTIDYFASQGIKLNAEEDNKDKLTTRLKSFTDWLKSMKKIHPEKLSREIDDATELNIKTDAEHSNDQSEILTETMAEVFLKQGLNEKALEVYEKLSLLNPSKSDYFAAKISALKAIGI